MRTMFFTQAIDDALAQAMAVDPNIIVFGEDVPLLRRNLLVRFGPRRVRGTPISESAFLGAGVAAAMAGLHPVVELYMVDFLGVCMDALLNHAAKVEAFSGGKWTSPVVVRVPCGGGYGDGGQHEQSLWGWLAHIPGLTILVPSTPADAGGLMLSALKHEFTIRAGQFQIGFDREGAGFLDDELTFGTRSLMTRHYPRWGEQGMPPTGVSWHWDYELQNGSYLGYDRGFQLGGSIAEGAFDYKVGMFNGGGPNLDNDNRDIMVAVRLQTDPLGRMTEHMSDLDASESPLLSIGAGFAYDLPEHRDPIDPELTYNSSDVNITGDVHFKWMGLSTLVGVFYRRADHGAVYQDAAGEELPINSMGFVGQLAYHISMIKLEPAFRYGFYDGDVDRELDHVHEFTGALNYYVYGRHLKAGIEWRGLFAARKETTYLLPWGVWFEDAHELMVTTQVAF